MKNSYAENKEAERNQKCWDYRFLDMAAMVASWSKDPSTKVGAVIVAPDRTVVSLGYNGFPRGMRDSLELYLDRDEKLKRVVHAEMNAILTARRDLTDCTLYTWPFLPCNQCASMIMQTGITRVVSVTAEKELAERWGMQDSIRMLEENNVVTEQLDDEC